MVRVRFDFPREDSELRAVLTPMASRFIESSKISSRSASRNFVGMHSRPMFKRDYTKAHKETEDH